MSATLVAEHAAASPVVDEIEKSERMLLLALGAFVIVQLWVAMIGTSFWLDETGTWWIIKDGPGEAIHRALSWSRQSPLFYLIEWASSRIFGLNEIGLRIPSVLAISATIWFLHDIAARLFNRRTATASAFVFLCVGSFFAVDARPYALAILCITVATWSLLRWSTTSRIADAAMFVAAGTLAVYAHCVLALGLAAAIIYGIARFRKETARLYGLGLMVLAIAVLSFPLVPELLRFYTTRSAHTFTGRPAADEILMALVPCALTGALVLVAWLAMVFRRDVDLPEGYTHERALLIGVWALFAPLFLAALSSLTDIHLFVDRYYSCALPGQAVIVGILLASIRPHAVRKALFLVIGVGAIAGQGKLRVSSHSNDDWRSAMDLLRRDAGSAPVLLVSPFAEGTDFESIRNPALRDILYAPEVVYGMPPGAIRLPHVFAAKEHGELEQIAARLESEPRIYLIADKPDRSYETWLAGRLASHCVSPPLEQSFGYVWVARFVCEKR